MVTGMMHKTNAKQMKQILEKPSDDCMFYYPLNLKAAQHTIIV